ncbi:MAG TPA: TSUP family transporter [Solirubrobacteraceae bacterium]|nr:TSUP family transporter [Solirubrobacteraceae bacterium]
MDPLLVVFGLGVGVLVGMTGVGGGSLMTPLLILVFGIKPVLAVGTDVAHAAVTKTGTAERERDTVPMELRHKVAAGLLGVSVGVVLGITSAGLGALIAVVGIAFVVTWRVTRRGPGRTLPDPS